MNTDRSRPVRTHLRNPFITLSLLLFRLFAIFLTGFFFLSIRCSPKAKPHTLFSLLSPAKSGISFSNNLTFTEEYNPYTFKNFLNGGGVAAGDINNDGLCDLFFAGNMVSNKLYLNKGNLKFEDITGPSGTASNHVWSSGVSMADINGDGWLDIYVCKSGKPEGERRHNELFLNNGDLTFSEVSTEAGLGDLGLSTHAVFFDYDRDGDLDCYLLNNSIRSVGSYDLVQDSRLVRDSLGGNKLYQNNLIRITGGQTVRDSFPHFTDVSETAGIYGSAIGFGLGVTVADLNGDHWPDLYVSNDFFERDYLYINQRNGRFKECLTESTQEISLGSMGADIADLNEDGWPEIFVTEMLPADPVRYKTKAVFDNWPKYQQAHSKGYHRQFGRNVLQLHRGMGPDSLPYFSEIGRLKNVHASEWSWGALLADYNNDGLKDIFVANGIYKDLIDLDHVNFYFNPEAIRSLIKSKKEVITTMFDAAESVAVPNNLFLQDSNFQFHESASTSGLEIPTFSNGSSYADLDNDGDLELIINNVNMSAMIFQNHANELGNHFIRVKLKGTEANTNAIGSKMIVHACGKKHHLELHPMRGFQSTVESILSVGLGDCEQVDSLVIIWPDGTQSTITKVKIDTLMQIDQGSGTIQKPGMINHSLLLVKSDIQLPFHHMENVFSDFDRDRLSFIMNSNEGPGSAVADIDGDGLEDIVVGNAHGYRAAILFQQPDGSFKRMVPDDLAKDSLSEDNCILIADVNCDHRPDLYFCSGSSELPVSSSAMKDRLYLNLGDHQFKRNENFYHPSFGSHHAVCISDYDKDNDQDLVTFSRLIPFAYGVPPKHTLYQNRDCKSWTESESDMLTAGMVTSAISIDMDKDSDEDIVVAYDYGPIRIFTNTNGTFKEQPGNGLSPVSGLWKNISAADIDHDGDIDLVGCNHGLNSRLKADTAHPLILYVNDFDRNGQTEQILCWRRNGSDYPVALKDDLLKQLPYLNKKYTTYTSFATANMQDMFEPQLLNQSITYILTELRSGIFYNNGGKFTFQPLPDEAQITTQYYSYAIDINQDSQLDLILGGNQYAAKPEIGINAASYGTVLVQRPTGIFLALTAQESGLLEIGSIRRIHQIIIKREPHLLIVKNNDTPTLYRISIPTHKTNSTDL